ncbi:hypothetical protein L207DRAFT_220066 [Hyaloscypha variabilis F]|uniref:Cora-domain-containing protein n=1 Tax=Hyaloscypha variabilis (strain UAMH 11265 / GT02V1 / F) TaxID=1149755 RepID=A0A2J6S7J5_HYAVF|nr:hypothetical protein L207DRAFT_220066 [Hyaloscypha variabilis F]
MHLTPYPSFSGLRTDKLDSIGNNIRLFHLNAYEVSSEWNSDHTIWKHGALPGKKKWLLQRAYTLSLMYRESNPFWTLVFLLPPERSRAREIETQLQTTICKNMPLAIVIADATFCILESMWKGWTTLIAYIDELLRTGDEIFDLEAHDNLIFDDDLYTRSRRYFWVINCVNESTNLLQRNMQAWTKHREEILPLGQEPLSVKLGKEFDNSIQKCDEVLARLVEVKESFNEQRTKAVALRDGLFSASAVMESRASTRLGENVKLLTYVSIFYLPLAFCTSIWSTTDTFGYRNLVITMVAIGFLTYLVVFNLNLLVIFSKTSYSSLKINVISSMQADSRKGWGKRGELFHKYRPRETADQSEPSEWWILVYLLQRALDVLSFRRDETSEKGPKKSKRKWYTRLWWGAEKGGRNSGPQTDDTGDAQA